MNTSVDTGGGAQVGRDLSAGRDFVGRDQVNIQLIGEVIEHRHLELRSIPDVPGNQRDMDIRSSSDVS